MPGRAVEESDYRQVAQILETEGKPGDAVLLHPWWTERARLFVPPQFPVVGHQGSDEDPLTLHPRIWVLSQPRMGSDFRTANPPVGAAREFGNLKLQLYENRKHRALKWDARNAVAQGRAWLEGPDGSRQDCRFDGRAHRCANQSEIAVEWHEIKFAPQKCIRLFPPGGAAKAVLELTGAAAAPGMELRAGLVADHGYYHTKEFTPVDVTVQVNGAAALALTVPVGFEGQKIAQGPALPEGATVTISTRSENPNVRSLCFELYGLEAARP
jgi:hypothetical protein